MIGGSDAFMSDSKQIAQGQMGLLAEVEPEGALMIINFHMDTPYFIIAN
jgi:hypothetical protein